MGRPDPSRPRWVLHADMDAFYASVEQRDRPEWRGLPVIVGASSPRGVVSAASYEARAFGVRSAMPGFQARRLCPDGIFVGGDMKKYAAVSRKVHAAFEELANAIEPLALDEAFLEVTEAVRIHGSPEALGQLLKERVRALTGLVVSVGVAPNKLVAKMACSAGKPDGLKVVFSEDVEAFLRPMPVRRLWGVGPVLEARLLAAGFRTLADLADGPPERLARVVGDRAGALARLARGDDSRPVATARAARSIGEENTFERDVSDRATVVTAITAHAEEVARRLRAAGYVARSIVLKAKLARRKGPPRPGRNGETEPAPYMQLTRQRTLLAATSDARRIAATAIGLWDALDLREPIRLVGVTAAQLDKGGGEQLELFAADGRAGSLLARRRGAPASRSNARVGPALDAIRQRFGDDAIARGARAPEKITHGRRGKVGGDGDPGGGASGA